MVTFKAKALVLAAVAAMVMGVVGCGSSGKKADQPGGGDTSGTTSAPADSAAATTTAAK